MDLQLAALAEIGKNKQERFKNRKKREPQEF